MKPLSTPTAICCVILAVALGVRLGAAWWWESRLPAGVKYAFGDSDGYVHLAGTIAAGEPYQYGSPDLKVFRTPGYPLLIAPLCWVYGGEPPPMAIRTLNACLGTCAVAGVMSLTALLFDFRSAAVAGSLAAVYPGAVSMSVFILAEAPFCPLMLLQLIAWTKAWQSTTRAFVGFAVLAGLAAGLATLMRPSWLLFTPFAVAAALLLAGNRTKQLQIAAVMLISCAVVMTPWWLRNYSVTGTFVPTTLQVGASLYDGLSPTATGASDMQFVESFREQLRAEDAAAEPPAVPFEVRLDQRMKQAALNWAADNPAAAFSLAGRKLVRMWSPLPNDANFRGPLLTTVTAIGYLPLLAAAVWGAFRFARRDWPYALCLIPAVYFTLLHMVFVSSLRYRQPAMLVLIILAAGAIAYREQQGASRGCHDGDDSQNTGG